MIVLPNYLCDDIVFTVEDCRGFAVVRLPICAAKPFLLLYSVLLVNSVPKNLIG
jgi:hypothetical protein